jgi:hypothetical protein
MNLPSRTLRIARIFFSIAALVFLLDGQVHYYKWPGETFQPGGWLKMIHVLGTHSREGNDYWMMIFCWLFAFLIWRREQTSREDR